MARRSRSQAVQELESGETERCPACGIGFRQEVEDLVGTTVDEVESVESEGRPGAIPKEPLEAGAVGGLDADAPIEARTAAVIPAEHVLGVVGLQEAVAAEMPQDPGAFPPLPTPAPKWPGWDPRPGSCGRGASQPRR